MLEGKVMNKRMTINLSLEAQSLLPGCNGDLKHKNRKKPNSR